MDRWARLVIGGRWFWIAVWPVAAFFCWYGAPRLSNLLQDDAHGFVPAEMPSQQAEERLRREFPEFAPGSRAAALFVRESGLSADDRAYIAATTNRLAEKKQSLEWQVRGTAVSPGLRPLFESADGCAAIVVLDLPADMLTHSTVNRVRAARAILDAHPPPDGLVVEVTGSGALGELLDANSKRDVDLTTAWTFAAVVVILLWIYRSPVAMLLPVLTIGVALATSLGLLGRAAKRGLPINGLVEMFVVVLVVGTAVDYCLFLFARFREELSIEPDVRRATMAALGHSGTAIIGSTGTNAAGLATLVLAQHRDLNTSGPSIAAALCLGALVVLTFTPALMSVVGRVLLWPGAWSRGRDDDGALWQWAGRVTTQRPWVVIMLTLLFLAAPAAIATRIEPLYDSLEEFPQQSSFVRGAHLYSRHFHQSEEITELTLVISTDRPLNDEPPDPLLKESLRDVVKNIKVKFPVAYVRHLGDPLGDGQADVLELFGAMAERMAMDYFVGRSRNTMRMDLGIKVEGRTVRGMELVDRLAVVVQDELQVSRWGLRRDKDSWRVEVAGEAARYRDIRVLRRADFRLIAVAATLVIGLILLAITRSPVVSLILIGASLLTYYATYGATWLIVTRVFGVESVGHRLHFLLFIILMSLGQDYNIFVVTRIFEELRRGGLAQAVQLAVQRTGRVVSSCGIIMAAAFGSMMSGSLLLMKQFAIALALGILLDTFVIRPLLVPALIMVTARRKKVNRDP